MSVQAPIKFTFIGSDGLEKTKFVPPNLIEEFKLKYPKAQRQEGSPSLFGDNKSEIYQPGKKSGADQPQVEEVNQPQNNQQKNTESSSENISSESQSTEPILKFTAMGPFYEDASGKIIKDEDLNIEQKEKLYKTKKSLNKSFKQYKKVPGTNKLFSQYSQQDDGSWYENISGAFVQVPEKSNLEIELNKINNEFKSNEEIENNRHRQEKIKDVKKIEEQRFDILDEKKLLKGLLDKDGKSIYQNPGEDLMKQLQLYLGDDFTYELLNPRTNEPIPKEDFNEDGDLKIATGGFYNFLPNDVKISYTQPNGQVESVVVEGGLSVEKDFKDYNLSKTTVKDSKIFTQDKINKNSQNILNFLQNTVYGDEDWLKEKQENSKQLIEKFDADLVSIASGVNPDQIIDDFSEKAGYTINKEGDYEKIKNEPNHLFRPYTVETGKEEKYYLDGTTSFNPNPKNLQGQTFLTAARGGPQLAQLSRELTLPYQKELNTALNQLIKEKGPNYEVKLKNGKTKKLSEFGIDSYFNTADESFEAYPGEIEHREQQEGYLELLEIPGLEKIALNLATQNKINSDIDFAVDEMMEDQNFANEQEKKLAGQLAKGELKNLVTSFDLKQKQKFLFDQELFGTKEDPKGEYKKVLDYDEKFFDTDYDFPINEGDEALIVTIEGDNGKKYSKQMSQKDYDNWMGSIAIVNSKNELFRENHDKELNELYNKIDKKADISKYYDFIQKNYNDSEKFFSMMGGQAEDILYKIGYTSSKIVATAADLVSLTDYEGTGKSILLTEGDSSARQRRLNQKIVNFNNLKKASQQYDIPFRQISFEDKDRSGLTTLKFVSQEIATQGSIFATIMLPGGMSLLGAYSAGEQLGTMYQNDFRVRELEDQLEKGIIDKAQFDKIYKAERLKEKTTMRDKYLSASGYAAFEVLPEYFVTRNLIINALQKAPSQFIKGKNFQQRFKLFKKSLPGHTRNVTVGTILERESEALTTIGQNIINNRNLDEGLDHARFSGGLFGGFFSSVPAVRGMMANFYSAPSTIETFQKNGKRIESLTESLYTAEFNATKKKLQKEGNRNPTKKQIEDAINKGEGGNSEATEAIQNKLNDLISENQTIVETSEDRLNNVHTNYLQDFSQLKKDKLEIQRKAQEIFDDKTLDEKTKNEEINALKEKYDSVNNSLNIMGTSDLFKDSRFDNYLAGVSRVTKSGRKRSKEANELFNEAAQELLGRGNVKPTETQIRREAEIIYNTREINKDYNNTSKQDLGDSFTNLQTVEDAVKWIQNKKEFTDNEKAELIKEVQAGAHGSNIKKGDGNYIAFQVVENMAKDGRLETRTHERGHTALGKIIGQNPEAFRNIADQLVDYVDSVDPALGLLLRQRTRGMDVDEKITNFMELVGSNKVLKKNKGLGALIANSLMGQANIPYNFQGETDAVTFVTKLAEKIKAGTLSGLDIKAAKQAPVAKEAQITDKQIENIKERLGINKGNDIKLSKDAKPAIDELGKMGWTTETWKTQGSDFAISEMRENKMLDGLIANKLKVPLTPNETSEFINKVYSELTNHIKNFDPKINDSLFGWVNSQIANKAGNVYNREYKITQRTQDIDATTVEGRPIIQIEADTSTELDFIDNISLTSQQVDQKSKLRQDLKLDNDMMDKVRKAVIKTFGTKLPDINTKKFKDELQKRFRTELKKTIQDMIGSRTDYDNFLNENFEAVYNSLPVQTLVQMERNVKPEQRIFTESQRVTKPTDVDRLISQGLLPKNTNRTSGPQLHKRKPYPGIEKVMAFYRGVNMQQELGYEVGASTLGTRKDKLAMELGVELAFDATSEVLQDPAVQERRQGILQLQGQEQVTNELAIIAKQIDRDPNIKFSNNPKTPAQSGSKILQDSVDLVNAIGYQGDLAGIAKLNSNGNYIGVEQYADIDPKIVDFIVKNFYENNKIALHSADVLRKIAASKLLPAGDIRTKGFEQFVINQFGKIKGTKILQEFQSEEGVDIPDVYAKWFGKDFNIEVKMFDAQVSSLTINDVDLITGKVTIDKINNLSKENQNKINEKANGLVPVLKDVQIRLKDMAQMSQKNIITLIKEANSKLPPRQKIKIPKEITKENISDLNNWNNPKSFMPYWAHGILKAEGYWKRLTQRGVFDQSLIEQLYLNKLIPTNYIYMLGKGLFSIGTDNLNIGVPKLEGLFSVPIRQVKASARRTIYTYKNKIYTADDIKADKMKDRALAKKIKTEGVKSIDKSRVNINIRALPVAIEITSKSNIDILDQSGIDALSKAGEKLKMSKKADDTISLDGAFNERIKYSKSAERVGASVFDFDDTLAFTKSGVRVTMPNPSGAPKPSRKVIFLAGGAGSGKGNVIKKLGLENSGFKIVNSDISLEWLKKNSGLPADMRDLTKEQRSTLGKLGAESRKIARRKMMKYQGNANGVVVDGTGGSVKSMQKLVQEFQDKGYDVSMLFVDTSLEVALDRNRKRKERSLLDVIVKRNHESVQKNKPEFKTMFGDRFMEVNTDNLTQKDAMPDDLVSQMDDFVSGYEKRRLDAEEFATQGQSILEQGGEFDFSEFNNVVDGTPGPLLDKAKQRIDKFGNKDVFVLTARPPASAGPIQQFLKSQGLDIPIENITGLANSTGDAKAEWILGKINDGYNDMYFVDDAIQNVEAVKAVLDQLDIKSDVVQAKIKFSKNASKELNDMIERKKKIDSKKVFSGAEARARGRDIGRFDFYIPPSAEDFKGLLYYFLGKGKQGDADMKFFNDYLLKPFAGGIRAWNTYKQNMADDFRNLKKQNPKVVKKLNDKVKGTSLTNDSAIRVYLWNKAGKQIPNISKQLEKTLVDHINNNPDLKSFADALSTITKIKDGYTTPGQNWVVGSIARDLSETVNKVGRKQFLNEWIDNKDQIFTPENLNKIEAAYGTRYREALENILFRMENGGNRVMSNDRDTNFMVNWINGAVGSIMFFNMRSAILQTISAVNFINFSDNNIFKATKAFANQPQFWKDFAMLFNSDQLKQRRRGLQTDVSASELVKSFKENGNTYEAVVNFLLEKGFTPTQIADSTAIAFGGASFYRNRFKKYKKQGMTDAKAKEQAMLDFQEIAEETQQSSREDLVSKQQASILGRIVLAFQNVTMQYGRLTKKALSDLTNRRGDTKTNISKILYYGAVQNIVFASLQSALAFMMFGGGEEEEVIKEKEVRVANSILDSFLRGTGIYGAMASTLKNVAVQWHVESQKAKEGFKKDEIMNIAQEAVNLSPPMGAKLRKLIQAYKMKEFGRTATRDKLKYRLENPKLASAVSLIEGVTNIPLARLLNKANNLEEAITGNHETWKRVAMTLGWSRWELGLKDEEVEAAREEVKEEKKEEKRVKQEEKKEEKRKEKEEQKKKEEEEKKKKGIKTVRCSGIRSNGTRCKLTTETAAKTFLCVHHKPFKDGSDTDGDGKKEYRCIATKSNGQRCKNKTENKNKKCYAHQ